MSWGVSFFNLSTCRWNASDPVCIWVIRRLIVGTVAVNAARTLRRSHCDLRSVARSVCWFNTALHGLRCHPWPCMLLNLRSIADSIPSALTIHQTVHKFSRRFSCFGFSSVPTGSLTTPSALAALPRPLGRRRRQVAAPCCGRALPRSASGVLLHCRAWSRACGGSRANPTAESPASSPQDGSRAATRFRVQRRSVPCLEDEAVGARLPQRLEAGDQLRRYGSFRLEPRVFVSSTTPAYTCRLMCSVFAVRSDQRKAAASLMRSLVAYRNTH